jgi:hypothetical protein
MRRVAGRQALGVAPDEPLAARKVPVEVRRRQREEVRRRALIPIVQFDLDRLASDAHPNADVLRPEIDGIKGAERQKGKADERHLATNGAIAFASKFAPPRDDRCPQK